MVGSGEVANLDFDPIFFSFYPVTHPWKKPFIMSTFVDIDERNNFNWASRNNLNIN